MTTNETIFHKYIKFGKDDAQAFLYSVLCDPINTSLTDFEEHLEALEDGFAYTTALPHHYTLKKDLERKYNYHV